MNDDDDGQTLLAQSTHSLNNRGGKQPHRKCSPLRIHTSKKTKEASAVLSEDNGETQGD